jgi:hypothetical protein
MALLRKVRDAGARLRSHPIFGVPGNFSTRAAKAPTRYRRIRIKRLPAQLHNAPRRRKRQRLTSNGPIGSARRRLSISPRDFSAGPDRVLPFTGISVRDRRCYFSTQTTAFGAQLRTVYFNQNSGDGE